MKYLLIAFLLCFATVRSQLVWQGGNGFFSNGSFLLNGITTQTGAELFAGAGLSAILDTLIGGVSITGSVNVVIDVDADFTSLINAAAIVFNIQSGATVTATGNVTFDALSVTSATLTVAKNSVSTTSSATLNAGASLVNNGMVTVSGDLTFSAEGTAATLSGTGSTLVQGSLSASHSSVATISGAITVEAGATFAAASSATFSASTTITGDISNDGTVAFNGALSLSSSTVSGTGALTASVAATLSDTVTFGASAAFNAGFTTSSGAAVTFNAATTLASSVNLVGSASLALNGATTTLSGTAFTGASATVAIANSAVTTSSDVSFEASATLTSVAATGLTSTVTFAGAVSATGSVVLTNAWSTFEAGLTAAADASVTLNAAATLAGKVQLNSGSSLSTNGVVFLGGATFSGAGSFVASSTSTVIASALTSNDLGSGAQLWGGVVTETDSSLTASAVTVAGESAVGASSSLTLTGATANFQPSLWAVNGTFNLEATVSTFSGEVAFSGVGTLTATSSSVVVSADAELDLLVVSSFGSLSASASSTLTMGIYNGGNPSTTVDSLSLDTGATLAVLSAGTVSITSAELSAEAIVAQQVNTNLVFGDAKSTSSFASIFSVGDNSALTFQGRSYFSEGFQLDTMGEASVVTFSGPTTINSGYNVSAIVGFGSVASYSQWTVVAGGVAVLVASAFYGDVGVGSYGALVVAESVFAANTVTVNGTLTIVGEAVFADSVASGSVVVDSSESAQGALLAFTGASSLSGSTTLLGSNAIYIGAEAAKSTLSIDNLVVNSWNATVYAGAVTVGSLNFASGTLAFAPEAKVTVNSLTVPAGVSVTLLGSFTNGGVWTVGANADFTVMSQLASLDGTFTTHAGASTSFFGEFTVSPATTIDGAGDVYLTGTLLVGGQASVSSGSFSVALGAIFSALDLTSQLSISSFYPGEVAVGGVDVVAQNAYFSGEGGLALWGGSTGTFTVTGESTFTTNPLDGPQGFAFVGIPVTLADASLSFGNVILYNTSVTATGSVEFMAGTEGAFVSEGSGFSWVEFTNTSSLTVGNSAFAFIYAPATVSGSVTVAGASAGFSVLAFVAPGECSAVVNVQSITSVFAVASDQFSVTGEVSGAGVLAFASLLYDGMGEEQNHNLTAGIYEVGTIAVGGGGITFGEGIQAGAATLSTSGETVVAGQVLVQSDSSLYVNYDGFSSAAVTLLDGASVYVNAAASTESFVMVNSTSSYNVYIAAGEASAGFAVQGEAVFNGEFVAWVDSYSDISASGEVIASYNSYLGEFIDVSVQLYTSAAKRQNNNYYVQYNPNNAVLKQYSATSATTAHGSSSSGSGSGSTTSSQENSSSVLAFSTLLILSVLVVFFM